jgi:hypothetical protein
VKGAELETAAISVSEAGMEVEDIEGEGARGANSSRSQNRGSGPWTRNVSVVVPW